MSESIVVGLDGSDASLRALDYAIELARVGKQLVLVHVIDWSPFVIETFEENEYRGAIRKRQLDRAEAEILKPAAARVEAQGLHHEQETAFGAPAEEVVRIAEERGAALIVVGRTGTSKLERIMFGSKANRVIQISDLPVVIVP